MKPLSGAASVIAIIQIAQSIGAALKGYYESVRDAREDIQKLYDAIRSLETILYSFKRIYTRHNGQDLVSVTVFIDDVGPLKQTQAELMKLRAEFDADPLSDPTTKRFGKAVRALVWPFKKKDVERIVVLNEQHKGSLSL
ncbi:hypothetical protein BKA61DRAFT_696799 [Leptodontidium sp. MPI-SDFR-AT-0119]|nr:hypothetical protein BKA61DRAFT_696799 [Leptodontidium sp. MPI-SDFR-AT-0119]